MFEFEESNGLHDVFLNKHADSLMDYYISDSMQDIYDIDIRSEVATVVGGVSEFSSLMNFDLPSLDLDSNSNDVWLGSSRWSFGSIGTNSTDIYADVGECVNPNAVMPVLTVNGGQSSMLLKSPRNHLNLNRHHQYDSLLVSPREKKSHLTFSPSTIKLSQMNQENNINSQKRLMSINTMEANRENVKKDLSEELTDDKRFKVKGNSFKLAPGIGGLTFAQNAQKMELTKSHLKVLDNTIYSVQSKHKIQQSSSPKLSFLSHHQNNATKNNGYTAKNMIHLNGHHQKINYNVNSNVLTASNNNLMSQHSTTKKGTKAQNQRDQQISEFPKPAYSYSCLIAMALKNSRAGSLPVSEIYSFMCEHFPYFKTAPNGWKNSVRHNLSLNKCFEKIEKPVANGGQRKGCLWAMNPTKIAKMDEEVQKWSRKDPMAIKKAMVHPEHLEALERGEMKHGHIGESDDEENDLGSIENDEVHSESEQNEAEETFVNTPDSASGDNASSADDEPDVDYDVEVADFYSDIDIDESAREALALEISNEKELLQHLDDDNTNSLFSPHQPSAKRARLDLNFSIASNNSSLLNTSHSRRKTPHVNRLI
ncbi:unnamed protein product [Diamesa serratosioi]